MLGWNVLDLSHKAGVDVQAVVRFEAGREIATPEVHAAIRRAFEETGIEFRCGTPRRKAGL